ncbi:RICIN domain-containing protein [Nonomuraea terrae]|uniref:RICIN domain-containing protein n=1 Tax=Nonomuraea terrae TaxID=2530383 RepID=UPI0037B9B6E7
MSTEYARGIQPSRRRMRSYGLIMAAAALAAMGSLAAAPASAATARTVTPVTAAAAPPSGSTTVVNKNSGKCVDAFAAATADGTAVQQYRCNDTDAQLWRFQPTDSGYYRVGSALNPAQVWDDKDVSPSDGGQIQLWSYSNGANQQWKPVDEGNGSFHFVNRFSSKCLDVPAASTADSVRLQQYTCNGSAAQSFSMGAPAAPAPAPGTPDLGPNVLVFDPSTPAATIQSAVNSVFGKQERNQFGSQRHALLFKPGSYNVNVNVGFYTQVLGLGLSPDDVTINGTVHAEADWFDGNATQNFWRGAENLSVTPPNASDRWAVSQAAPYRRMHLRGNLALDDGGWSSGGLIADSKIDGRVDSGSQQQWLTRGSQIGGWSGDNWNHVFAGVSGAPATAFPTPSYTTVGKTPVTREKPFLYVDQAGDYQVFVPALRHDAQGASWTSGTTAGASIPIGEFFIAKPGDTAADVNAALEAGKNLLFTPGVYHLTDTIKVTRPDTVVLGLGLATLQADNGVMAMSVADVDGVKIAGLLIEAGTTKSPLLMQVGPAGAGASHADNPTSLHDVYFRVGGPIAGKATQSLVINSSDVIGDHMWLWRADHADNEHPGTVGWTTNTADTGLVVNGDDVTMYGLFVEHYQKYQVIWNGDGGRTYFFQNELPYDPPNQSAWMNGTTKGYAAYKVADSVTAHEAWGLGSYAFFNVNPGVVEAHSFEVPDKPDVTFHSLITVSLGGKGTISHVVNNTGKAADSGSTESTLKSYPAGSTGTITNRATGKCIGAAGGNTADGTAVDLYSCVGDATQRWTVSSDGSIRTAGKCLDVANSATGDGAKVQLYACNGSDAQKWYFTPAFDIVNPHADKCLDLTGNSTADFTKVQLWSCTGAPNQKWAAPSGLPSGAS